MSAQTAPLIDPDVRRRAMRGESGVQVQITALLVDRRLRGLPDLEPAMLAALCEALGEPGAIDGTNPTAVLTAANIIIHP